MAIPDLPVFFDMEYTTEKGTLTPDSLMYNDNLWQSLNVAIFLLNSIVASSTSQDGTVTNNGLVAPSKNTLEIIDYGNNANIPNGTAWFNTDSSKLNVKTAAGTIEEITSS